MFRVGYACMHFQSYGGKKRLTTGNTVRKATAIADPNRVHETTYKNLENLLGLVNFNIKHNIKCLRTSLIFPWYDLVPPETYKEWDKTLQLAKEIGNIAKKNNIRITAHPSHFVCLGSESESVVQNSLSELDAHGKMFDILGLPQDHYAKINIHVGGTYGGDFQGTAKRFCKNFEKLSDSVKNRLTVENDDKINGWGVQELFDLIHKEIKTPIVFDSLHWEHGPRVNGVNNAYSEALEAALGTWKGDIAPVVHHSQSATTERTGVRLTAHSEKYTKPFVNTSCTDVDIMLECKQKEVACLEYVEKFLKNS